jgi:uncharacterized Tic20 family protein
MSENPSSTPEQQPRPTAQPPAPDLQGTAPQAEYQQQGYQQGYQQAGYQPGSEQQGYQQAGYQQAGYQQASTPGYPQPYAAAGPAPLSPSDERTWSIAAHLSPFLASFVGLPFLGPLVIYLVFRDRGPFVRHHAAQALNFQIIVAIGILISLPLMIIIVGFITAGIIAVAAVVFQIVAAVEANNGKWYRYPLTPDWVK